MLIEKALSVHPDIEIAGEAYDGESGLVMMKSKDVDVVILDIGLPKMSGLEVLESIMATKPVPVIIFSALSNNEVNYSFKAIELGAVEIIEKPEATDLLDFKKKMETTLIKSIRTFADFEVITRTHRLESKPNRHAETHVKKHPLTQLNVHSQTDTLSLHDLHKPELGDSTNNFPIIIIASSTGGPQTLRTLMADLTHRKLDAAVVIVQHMAEGFMKGFCEWLSGFSALPMILPENNSRMSTNTIYIAPGEFHLTFSYNEKFSFLDEPPIFGIRPSADILISSASKVFQNRLITVILTGMGSDGTEGIREVKKHNGTVIAQDEKSSIIFGMPKSAIDSGCVDQIVSLENMGKAIEECCHKFKRR